MDSKAIYREALLVEFTAKNLWPIVRPVFKKYLSVRCKTCVLSENYTKIHSDGICDICKRSNSPLADQTVDERDRVRLGDIIRSKIGVGASGYDALILVSGGKDSAYMLNRIQTEYPDLRLLSLLIDNGYMSPFALRNARRLLKHFDIPHITLRLQPSFVKKAFRMVLLNLDKQTGYSIVDLLDGYLTSDQAKNLALSLEIPLILCGLAKIQTQTIFGPTVVELPQEKERQSRTHHAGLLLQDYFDEIEMKYWFQAERWDPEKIPRFVLPFTVWDLEEEEIIREVTQSGLLDKKYTRPLVTNNALIPVIGIAEVAKFGYSSFEVEFAEMVRCGKSDRDYWLNMFQMLEYSAHTGRFIGKSVNATLRALDLTPADLGIVL